MSGTAARQQEVCMEEAMEYLPTLIDIVSSVERLWLTRAPSKTLGKLNHFKLALKMMKATLLPGESRLRLIAAVILTNKAAFMNSFSLLRRPFGADEESFDISRARYKTAYALT